MLAIYKKELRSYFTSVIGFLFMAFFLAITGIYTVALNMVNAYSNFEYVLDSISFVFILLAPILTMRVMAEEKHQKTDQLLFTSPVSVQRIVMGKYLAVLTLFGIVTAVCMVYPIILSRYGAVDFVKAYGGLIGFFLLGAAYLAIGVLISSLTESQIIAAVISFLTFFIMYMMPGISSLLPSDHLSCLVILCGIVFLVSLLLYSMMRSIKITLLTAVAGAGILTGIYLFNSSLFDGLLLRICNVLSITSRYENFTTGILDITSLIYYISIIFLSLFFTIIWIQNSFTTKRLKSGAYHSALMIVVLCITVVVNLIAGQAGLTLDLSSDSMYTLTKDTKQLVKGLKEDVSVYYVVQQGNEVSQVENIISQYKGLSRHLKVTAKDPVLYPSFTSEYTEEEVMDNSAIVVNEKTGVSKYISFGDMLISEMDYQTYQTVTTAIDVEGQITAAIQYVTAKDLPILYEVTGHGEASLGSTITSGIEKLNMSVKSLETIAIDSVPEDCDVLLLNAPTKDLSKDEVSLIKKYLEGGGKALLMTGYTAEPLTNYEGLLKTYGLSLADGVVFEGAGSYLSNYPAHLLPSLEEHEITSGIDSYVVAAVTQGMKADEDIRSTVTIQPLLSSSGESYSKVDMESENVEKEEGDIEGPFTLGAAVTESFDGKETKLVVYSTPYLVDDNFLVTNQFGNEKLFLNSLSWMNRGVESNLSIPSRSVAQTYLTVQPATLVFWAATMILVLPAGLILTGIVIWYRRRKAWKV